MGRVGKRAQKDGSSEEVRVLRRQPEQLGGWRSPVRRLRHQDARKGGDLER